MSKIKTVTKYTFKGVEYNSLKEVQDAVHNTIGTEFFDKMQRLCPLGKEKDYFKLLELICSKEIREMLIDCFTTTYIETSVDIDSSERYCGEIKTIVNILDVNF